MLFNLSQVSYETNKITIAFIVYFVLSFLTSCKNHLYLKINTIDKVYDLDIDSCMLKAFFP